jgi:hypothetical protein
MGSTAPDWLIEGRRKDIYRAVSRWSPDGAIYDLGKLFLDWPTAVGIEDLLIPRKTDPVQKGVSPGGLIIRPLLGTAAERL